MANRRMFSLKIIDSDAFLYMPQSSQLLYFHLSMRADDDGFVGNHKKIMRMIGSSEDDYKVLLTKRFILNFESGVVVIKHWKIHNYIQVDRYQPTQYIDEKNKLLLKENGAYTDCIQNVSNSETQVRIELGKDSKEDTPSKKFVKPTLEEVSQYCHERGNSVDPQRFVDHYESNGWKVGGRSDMKDWRASVRTWEKNSFGGKDKKTNALVDKHTPKIINSLERKTINLNNK